MAEKFIFVTGGVCSSLGKGIAAASLGTLLEAHGYKVSMIKIDPYINVDAGTMSPFQHGEVFVTDDGAETDLDLGNYSRFTNAKLSGGNSITTGQIYQEVIRKERKGEYLGKCVQVIPHITDEICQRIYQASAEAEIAIVEVGGTVGDIESIPFLEGCRQIILRKGHANAMTVHLTLVPEVGGELKTKLTQHAVKESLAIGLQPDILLCRSPEPLDSSTKRKIAHFTNVCENAVISAHNEPSHIYRIPLNYRAERLDRLVVEHLGLEVTPLDLSAWEELDRNYRQAGLSLDIGMVGKYIDLPDTYKSIDEALIHAGLSEKLRINIRKIDAEQLEKGEVDPDELFLGISGLLVPGGFGNRGVEGMIHAVHYARRNGLPFFGICLGMQVMVIEFARHVLGIAEANSTEFVENCREPVISLLEEQGRIDILGGSMRLGLSTMELEPTGKFARAYGATEAKEVHRHRYEVNNAYLERLESAGLTISARYSSQNLVEGCEWQGHPFGLGTQAHPEFHSQPVGAHPLFRAFIQAGAEYAGVRQISVR
ncbi:CTP synthase [Candidatus Haliotispira prima]|uniref:CTP synthase (glutamine hydrolyzing) n=2 Tax=Candidatus Haliotispira prima TaxID=3034016 RepID=A0ABY8MK87_9SPIO|nr:CTP synthase [Candidatus Haliotispira prima]